MGFNILSGSVIVFVILIGNYIYFGFMVKILFGDNVIKSFEWGVFLISRFLISLIFIMVFMVFLINGIIK